MLGLHKPYAGLTAIWPHRSRPTTCALFWFPSLHREVHSSDGTIWGTVQSLTQEGHPYDQLQVSPTLQKHFHDIVDISAARVAPPPSPSAFTATLAKDMSAWQKDMSPRSGDADAARNPGITAARQRLNLLQYLFTAFFELPIQRL